MKLLPETIGLMCSSDYRDRFIAEYWQTKIRLESLKKLVYKIELTEEHAVENILPVKYNCPVSLLKDQMYAMSEYLEALEKRALVEHIDFDHPENIVTF